LPCLDRLGICPELVEGLCLDRLGIRPELVEGLGIDPELVEGSNAGKI